METDELIKEINKNMAIILPEKITLDELRAQLAFFINHLIQTDFQKLIMLLYRIDVSETRLKTLLQQHPREDAGKIITGLVIERQLQKINSRKHFKPGNDEVTEEEKW